MSHIVFLHFTRAPFWCPTFSLLSRPTLPANSYFVAGAAFFPSVMRSFHHLHNVNMRSLTKGASATKQLYTIHIIYICLASFLHFFPIYIPAASEILYLAGKESSDPAAVTFHFLLPDGTTRDTMAVWGCGRTGGKINSWRSSTEITKIHDVKCQKTSKLSWFQGNPEWWSMTT